MADEQEQIATRRRTPFSARLPQVPLNDATTIAQALSDLAGPAAAPIIAQRLHASPASSSFNTRLAAAGYFGLVSRKGDKYELTSTGLGLTAGDGASKKASAQVAVMTTNFGRLIQVLSGRSVNEETIAARLQTDLEVPAVAAQKLAGVLVASAEQAGILTDGRFNATEIEAAMASLPSPPAEPVLARPTARRSADSANGRKRQSSGEVRVREAQKSPKPPLAALSSTSGLTLNLQLNVNHLSVDEIVLLIEKLKAHPEA
jgi:hypothetical protein